MLYTYGGVFAALGTAPEPRYFDDSLLGTKEDARIFVASDSRMLTPEFMAGKLVVVRCSALLAHGSPHFPLEE